MEFRNKKTGKVVFGDNDSWEWCEEPTYWAVSDFGAILEKKRRIVPK